jgi:tetratricopeptide (TPR) repeat protein
LETSEQIVSEERDERILESLDLTTRFMTPTGNLAEVRAHAERAVSIAERLYPTPDKRLGLRVLFLSSLHHDDPERELALLRRALAILEVAPDVKAHRVGMVHWMTGNSLRRMQRRAEAEVHLRRAVELSADLPDRLRTSRMSGLCWLLREMGQQDAAAEVMAQIVQIEEAKGQPAAEPLAWARHELACILRHIPNRRREALEVAQRGFKEAGSVRTKAYLCGAVARIHEDLGEHDVASRELTNAINMAEADGDRATADAIREEFAKTSHADVLGLRGAE